MYVNNNDIDIVALQSTKCFYSFICISFEIDILGNPTICICTFSIQKLSVSSTIFNFVISIDHCFGKFEAVFVSQPEMFQRSRSKLEKFVTYNDGVPLATLDSLDEEPIGELDDTGKLNQNEKGEQSIGKEGLGVEVGMI